MNPSSGYSAPKRGHRSWRERETDEAGEAFDRRVKAQTRLLRAACEPWLARGRAVRLIYDRTFAFQTRGDMTGRMGTIARVPGPPFTDFVHVSFEPKGRQRGTRGTDGGAGGGRTHRRRDPCGGGTEVKARSLVRNPVLALPSMRALRSLPLHTRELLAELLGELALDARQRADTSWRRHKAPMAAYWKAVSVYAGHIRRALLTGEEIGAVAQRTQAGGDALTKRTRGEGSWERAGQAVGGPRSRLGALPDV